MSWRARKRKAQARALRRASKPIYAVGSTWPNETADEIIARCRALLGFTPMAEAVIESEMYVAWTRMRPAPLSPFVLTSVLA